MTHFNDYPRSGGSIVLPYWLRVVLWMVLPVVVILVALERGPGLGEWSEVVPLTIGCGGVLLSLVSGAAWGERP